MVCFLNLALLIWQLIITDNHSVQIWKILSQQILIMTCSHLVSIEVFCMSSRKVYSFFFYAFIDNSFTHFNTLPEEILPARQVLCLLSSTCHIGCVSPTSRDVAKWQLPMSAKMKPQEGKKRLDRNFILPSISKWLLSALHQSGETGTVHFYSRELDCGGGFPRKQGGSSSNDARWITGK